MSLQQQLQHCDWNALEENLLRHGYAVVDDLLSDAECSLLLECYSDQACFRKTVNMARHNFGNGEYKYFSYPLPELVQQLRTGFYPPLAKIANQWSSLFAEPVCWTENHEEFLKHCQQSGQHKATPLMLKYTAGDYNRLHQDLYGEVYFPFQLILLLSDPGADFEGGNLVLVENYPRMQSRPHVPILQKGSAVIIPTQERPVPGARGWRRAKMRHGVSDIRRGERYTLGIIFHDA